GEPHYRRLAVQQLPVPVDLQHPPAAFDRVVLAVIRWVIHQHDRQLRRLGKQHQPIDELTTATVVLRSVVEIQQQRVDLRVERSSLLPPLFQPVHDEVAGHFRGGKVQAQILGIRQEDPEGGQLAPWLEIMIGSFLAETALAAARKRTDQDRGLGVDRRTEGGFREGGSLVDSLEVPEDGVGFLYFFWGRLLTMVRRRKPKSLSFSPMVCTEGNC